MVQPKAYYSVVRIFRFTTSNFYSGALPSEYISRLLYRWHVALNKKVLSMVLVDSGCSVVACRRRFHMPWVNSFILSSTITFWWFGTAL